jgi:hypothetical protein
LKSALRRTEVEYAIVALGLSTTEIVRIVQDAANVTIDPTANAYLRTLNVAQLEIVWKRLSEDPRWRRSRDGRDD